MLKTIWTILVTIVLTIIAEVVILGAFIWFKNPYGIRDILYQLIFVVPQSQQDQKNTTSTVQTTQATTTIRSSNSSTTFSFQLTSQQKDMLKAVGVDPNSLPTKFTPKLKTCLVATLGVSRYDQIIGGQMPNFADLLKAKSCLIQ